MCEQKGKVNTFQAWQGKDRMRQDSTLENAAKLRRDIGRIWRWCGFELVM